VDIPFRKLNETLKAKGSNRTREIPSSILGGGIFYNVFVNSGKNKNTFSIKDG